MRLSRSLGLRNEEAVQSVKSLRTWQQALKTVKIAFMWFWDKRRRDREALVPDKARVLTLINKSH